MKAPFGSKRVCENSSGCTEPAVLFFLRRWIESVITQSLSEDMNSFQSSRKELIGEMVRSWVTNLWWVESLPGLQCLGFGENFRNLQQSIFLVSSAMTSMNGNHFSTMCQSWIGSSRVTLSSFLSSGEITLPIDFRKVGMLSSPLVQATSFSFGACDFISAHRSNHDSKKNCWFHTRYCINLSLLHYCLFSAEGWA